MTTHPRTLRSTTLSIAVGTALGMIPCLVLGACDKDAGDERDFGGSSSSSTSGTTTGGMTTTPFLTTSSSDGTTMGDSTSSTNGSTSTTTQDSTTTDASDTEMDTADEGGEVESESGEPHPGEVNCEARCNLEEMCNPGSGEDCFPECVDMFDFYEGPCIEAMDMLNGCVADLSCDDLAVFNDPSAPMRPCTAEEAALQSC